MVLLIIGALFIMSGLRALTEITEPYAFQSMLICFAIGGVLVYLGIKRMRAPKEPRAITPTPAEPAAPPIGSYTFQPTGTRFECKFPVRSFAMRQRVLERSKVGDPVGLQIYEWEGVPAVAVMNNRFNADLGVVKADQASRVVDLLNSYNVTGRIIKLTDFDMNNENYLSCEVRLEYYPK